MMPSLIKKVICISLFLLYYLPQVLKLSVPDKNFYILVRKTSQFVDRGKVNHYSKNSA